MMAISTADASVEHLDLADMRRRIRAIFVGSVGNLVEWYDFYAYAAFALYFAGAFFPNSDPVVQQLNAAVLFAAGFLVRPLGGWLFGYLADHYRAARRVDAVGVADVLRLADDHRHADLWAGRPACTAMNRHE
jgi:MFS family permease